MPGTCAHGYGPGECLICATLGTTTADRPAPGGEPIRGRTANATVGAGGLRRRRPDTLVAGPVGDERVGRRHHPLATLVLVLVAVGALVAAGWVIAGVVFALLRILEVVAVAVAASWTGYRVGHWRGRRGH